jgi:hypothetical protein
MQSVVLPNVANRFIMLGIIMLNVVGSNKNTFYYKNPLNEVKVEEVEYE